MRKLMIGLAAVVLVGCSSEQPDVYDLDAQLTDHAVYGTFTGADGVVVDFASIERAGQPGVYDVTIDGAGIVVVEPVLLEPTPGMGLTQQGPITVAEDPGGSGSQPPDGDPNGPSTIDDFRFSIVTELPNTPAVDALLLVADTL